MNARQPLLDTLRAAHLRLGMAAVIAAGLVLTLVSFVTLRSQVEQNLTLVARSISYTAEAAAVFGDAAAATEVLNLVAERENLRAASIVDARGRQLASYAARNGELLDAVMANVAGLLFAQEARAPIRHERRAYGEVLVQGRGVGSLMSCSRCWRRSACARWRMPGWWPACPGASSVTSPGR